MRLIGDFETEKEAITFSLILKRENIKSSFEPYEDMSSGRKEFRVWVYEEDQVEYAFDLYEKFKENPEDPFFSVEDLIVDFNPSPKEFRVEDKGKVINLSIKKKSKPQAYVLTYLFLSVCIVLFLFNLKEKKEIALNKGLLAEEVLLTRSQKNLMFDFPAAMLAVEEVVNKFPKTDDTDISDLSPELQKEFKEAEALPYWRGFYGMYKQYGKKWLSSPMPPMFEKIHQGEFWRLFTPCLMHSDFLHILFNMAWLWVLGKQIEERIKKGKMLLLIVTLAVVSNIFQYLASGPYFLGFSAVVVGFAGFIWSRQGKAPWEGYPLQKSTILFILLFVLAMFGLELASVAVLYLSSSELSSNVANTAHVVGGVVGIAMGRMNFFARGNE
ncbi:MAG: rhomboid family intramembrane serine protease [Chlamydiae bacterium]|nr:rhomboid family intramembrane serine protease [Chlamydiota bacterium]